MLKCLKKVYININGGDVSLFVVSLDFTATFAACSCQLIAQFVCAYLARRQKT